MKQKRNNVIYNQQSLMKLKYFEDIPSSSSVRWRLSEAEQVLTVLDSKDKEIHLKKIKGDTY